MTSHIERILILRSADCFSLIGLDVLAAIARRLRPETLLPGVPWQLGREALFVTDGDVFRQDSDGSRRRQSPGDVVGMISALARYGQGHVVVETPARALLLGRDDLEDLCLEDFAVGEALLRWLAGAMLRRTVQLPDGTSVPPEAASAEEPVHAGVTPLVRRIAALHASGVFPSTQADAIAELAHQAEEVGFRSGDRIWTAGEASDSFLLLLHGDVRCESKEGWHAHAGPYSLVGDLEALADSPREFTAAARTGIRALGISADSFLDILEDHPQLAVDFLGLLARRAVELGLAD